MAFLYVTGKLPEEDVDHKDANGLNNKWSNIRSVSRSINRRNSAKNTNNKSGVTGVYWHKKQQRWEVKLLRKTIGYADNIFEAACIRISKQNKEGGFTCRHGK